jgi:hypothetical protein
VKRAKNMSVRWTLNLLMGDYYKHGAPLGLGACGTFCPVEVLSWRHAQEVLSAFVSDVVKCGGG